MKNLILVGGGGHCKSVIEVAESAGYSILGILDMPELVGNSVLGYKVIGSDDDIAKFADEAEFIITVGFIKNPAARIRIFEMIRNAGGRFATLIASTAKVSRHAQIGEGSVVMHNAFVNAGAMVGVNCIINTASNLEHDVAIGDNTHVSTGVMVNGDCKVGERVFIGSQSVIVNGITICDDAIIGAGSVVHRPIDSAGIYFGNPAKRKGAV